LAGETTNFFTENLRWPIYRTPGRCFEIAPLGIGLGNFRSVFAFNGVFRLAKRSRASGDWLWSTIGWAGSDPGLILLLRLVAGEMSAV
jgi:hypothetical protein